MDWPEYRHHRLSSARSGLWRRLPRRGERKEREKEGEREGGNHHLLSVYSVKHFTHVISLIPSPSPWIATSFSLGWRVKMEAQRDEWWRFALGHVAGKEQNWYPSPGRPHPKAHVLCSPSRFSFKTLSWLVVYQLMKLICDWLLDEAHLRKSPSNLRWWRCSLSSQTGNSFSELS